MFLISPSSLRIKSVCLILRNYSCSPGIVAEKNQIFLIMIIRVIDDHQHHFVVQKDLVVTWSYELSEYDNMIESKMNDNKYMYLQIWLHEI
jgi:hypothetical protein